MLHPLIDGEKRQNITPVNFGSLGIAVKSPNIWWSIQSLEETTDLTDQKRIFTD
jgi:hypothetical protein